MGRPVRSDSRVDRPRRKLRVAVLVASQRRAVDVTTREPVTWDPVDVLPRTAADAIDNAIAWFEVNSGWAPPDVDELAEWVAGGVCRCPDDCLVAPEGWCDHGL